MDRLIFVGPTSSLSEVAFAANSWAQQEFVFREEAEMLKRCKNRLSAWLNQHSEIDLETLKLDSGKLFWYHGKSRPTAAGILDYAEKNGISIEAMKTMIAALCQPTTPTLGLRK